MTLTLVWRSPAPFLRCRTSTRISGRNHVALDHLRPFTAQANMDSASAFWESSGFAMPMFVLDEIEGRAKNYRSTQPQSGCREIGKHEIAEEGCPNKGGVLKRR